MIWADADRLGLRTDLAFDLDVVRFQSLLDARPPNLAAALALYHGELAEDLDLDCFAVDRQRLADVYEDALVRLAHRCLEDDDLACARTASLQLIARDPLREEAHAALIEVFGRSGSRDQVVRQYRRLVRLLDRELGIEPLAETRSPSAAPCVKRVSGLPAWWRHGRSPPGPSITGIHDRNRAHGSGRSGAPARWARRWGRTDVLRAKVRGALGSLIALATVIFFGLIVSEDFRSNLTGSQEYVVGPLTRAAPGVFVVSTLLATGAELARLSIRAAAGSAWTAVADNRWLEAGLVGTGVAIVGVLLGSLSGGWGQRPHERPGPGTVWERRQGQSISCRGPDTMNR